MKPEMDLRNLLTSIAAALISTNLALKSAYLDALKKRSNKESDPGLKSQLEELAKRTRNELDEMRTGKVRQAQAPPAPSDRRTQEVGPTSPTSFHFKELADESLSSLMTLQREDGKVVHSRDGCTKPAQILEARIHDLSG
jgi:hypothetical protein